MAASYKPLMLLALLDSINERGRARVTDVVTRFREFCEARNLAGLLVERASATMNRLDDLDDGEMQQIMRRMQFEKFERRKCLEYEPRELAFVRFALDLWKQIKPGDLADLRDTCEQSRASQSIASSSNKSIPTL